MVHVTATEIERGEHVSDYGRLAKNAAKPVQPTDFTAAWDRCKPIATAPDAVLERIEKFAAKKQIKPETLAVLDTRWRTVGKGPEHLLAWASFSNPDGSGIPTAVKYRKLGTDGDEKDAERGSVYLWPKIISPRISLEWLFGEGETDSMRLFELTEGRIPIVVLPAGVDTFKPTWTKIVPRGATCFLAYDDDEPGDRGAAKAARALNGRAVRVRPPEGVKDWCEWTGGPEEFAGIVREARSSSERTFSFLPFAEFIARDFPKAEPLLGTSEALLLGVGTFLSSTAQTVRARAPGRSTGSPISQPGDPGSGSRCPGRSGSA